MPRTPPESWRKEWQQRTMDLIDRYQPDHMYFNSAIPFPAELTRGKEKVTICFRASANTVTADVSDDDRRATKPSGDAIVVLNTTP